MANVLMMDCGDGMRRADNGCIGKIITAKTTSFTLKAIDTGKMYTNRGAGAGTTATLPAAVKNIFYVFGRPTAQTFTITATGGAKIDGGGANGSITVPAGGLVCIVSDGTDWYSMTTLNSVALSAIAHGTNGQLIVGQTGASSLYKTVSGDVTLDQNGAVAIGATKVLSAMLADGIPHTATVTIANADLKAIRNVAYTIVASPGANKMIEFLSATLVLVAGSNALTESADNLQFKLDTKTGVAVSPTIETTGFIDQTVKTATSVIGQTDTIVATSAAAAKALVLHNTGDGEFGGNVAADATLIVNVSYRIVATV